MFTKKAEAFVESYLFRARDHGALEQSVFAEGERRGFSERCLRRAGAHLGVSVHGDLWMLTAARAGELTRREIALLGPVPSARPEQPLGLRRAA